MVGLGVEGPDVKPEGPSSLTREPYPQSSACGSQPPRRPHHLPDERGGWSGRGGRRQLWSDRIAANGIPLGWLAFLFPVKLNVLIEKA